MPQTTINGINLYYELHGEADRPVLVLNNGIIMNAASSWVYQTKALSARYRLLLYDCRGQGQSDHPDQAYSMAQHAEDLFELLKALEIGAAHIAGISYGGEVAQAFALQHPRNTLSLILADTVSEVGPELRIVIESWIDALKTGDPLVFFNATLPWNFSRDFIEKNQSVLEDAKQRYALLDFTAIIRLCISFLSVDFTARLKELKMPVCILVGGQDTLKGVDYAQLLKAQIPHAEYHLLSGAGHASCWERPEEFNSIVLGFLAKHS